MPTMTVVEGRANSPSQEASVPCLRPGVDPDAWHPTGRVNEAYARQLCAGCPRIAECLRVALQRGDQGICGGTTEAARRRMLKVTPALGDVKTAQRVKTADAYVGLNDGLTVNRFGKVVPAAATPPCKVYQAKPNPVPVPVIKSTPVVEPVTEDVSEPVAAAPHVCLTCQRRTHSRVIVPGTAALVGQWFRRCRGCAAELGVPTRWEVAA